jgi:hypothetical protein
MRSTKLVTLVACLSCVDNTPGSLCAGSGRTVLDISYDYAEVRLRPTYDPDIRGTRKFRLILSGNNQVTVQQSNSAGGGRPSRSEWTNEMQAGRGVYSWRFAGPTHKAFRLATKHIDHNDHHERTKVHRESTRGFEVGICRI